MVRRTLYGARAVRNEPRRYMVLMIIPCPRRRRRRAASLVLGYHIFSFIDAVRHHSTRRLPLHPAIPGVVDVAFAAHAARAHDTVLGVIDEVTDAVTGHVAALVVAESRPVHARYPVRLHSTHFQDRRILQGIAAAHRVIHPRLIPLPVVFVASGPSPPARRRREPPDGVIGEGLISALPVYRPADADELSAVAGPRTAPHLPRGCLVPIAQAQQRATSLRHRLRGQLQTVLAVDEAFRRPVA